MKPVVERLMGKTIISVQAYEDTPLYGPQNMRIMAQSVLMGGRSARMLAPRYPGHPGHHQQTHRGHL